MQKRLMELPKRPIVR